MLSKEELNAFRHVKGTDDYPLPRLRASTAARLTRRHRTTGFLPILLRPGCDTVLSWNPGRAEQDTQPNNAAYRSAS